MSLYEESDCYNYLPGTKDNEGAWEYFDGLVLNVRKKASSLFLGERDSEEYRKLNTIIDETERFVKCFSCPGVAQRWREINPRMNYYDCAFEAIDACGPRAFVEAANRVMLAYIPTKGFGMIESEFEDEGKTLLKCCLEFMLSEEPRTDFGKKALQQEAI